MPVKVKEAEDSLVEVDAIADGDTNWFDVCKPNTKPPMLGEKYVIALFTKTRWGRSAALFNIELVPEE